MTSLTPDDDEKLKRIFHPYLCERRSLVEREGIRFAHYTSAEVLTSILRRKQIWMRNAQTMNDYSEIQYGFQMLQGALESEDGKSLQIALDNCGAKIFEEVDRKFQEWKRALQFDTYMICLSEHTRVDDAHGRLSMWRAYGGRNGVALVLKSDALFNPDAGPAAHASPVLYANEQVFGQRFAQFVEGISAERNYLRELDRSHLVGRIVWALRWMVLATKHPGFAEEREWRVVSSPTAYPTNSPVGEIEAVQGTPQVVLKLSLQGNPSSVLDKLDISKLLDRIIVGPCAFPGVTASALRTVLANAIGHFADQKIHLSGIPLRN